MSLSITILLIGCGVLVVVGAIAAGVYFYLHYQEQQQLKEQAELQQLNSQSRDALMNDRFKKEAINP